MEMKCVNEWPSYEFAIAFQPIVDVTQCDQPYAHEALVRGANGESAASVIAHARAGNFTAFDAACRNRAVELAQLLEIPARLSLNVTPAAIGDEHYGLHSTTGAARMAGFAENRLIFEISEKEPIINFRAARRWFSECRNRGALIAFDDFGSGYNGLNTLIELKPDILKLDMGLIRGIDSDFVRQTIVTSAIDVCSQLSITLIAEGVETSSEMSTLRDIGINLMQGYLFGRPEINRLPFAGLLF
jgi:EAL domain-containing protein (putative c-di-GMP-specific phosphodiesterase class I)